MTTVTLTPYSDKWKSEFEKIKNEIEAALGALCVGVEHVGSTAVEGIFAKPCIDLDVVIKDYSEFEHVKNRLAEIGYIHEGDLGIKDREAFGYFDKPHLYAHHLYVCPKHSEELRRHITFRDYLRKTPSAVKKYSEIKEYGAKLFPDDINKYIEYKSSCIEEMYKLCGLISD